MTERARVFGSVAGGYDRARPSYPREAVDWLLHDDVRVVADVGAGTGKLSGVVAATGRQVVAIDPDAAMLAQLASRYPDIPTRTGTAESLPLEDASVDAVTFGQVWHWVDVAAASAEAARVLRPGGVLGLVWNVRDAGFPWVVELEQAMGSSTAERFVESGEEVTVGSPFGEVSEHMLRWQNPVDVDTLVELAASRSYVIAAPERDRARMLEQVRRVGERAADDQGRLTLPYRTHAFRTSVPGDRQ